MLSEKASWMDTVIRPRALEIDFLFIRVLQRLSVIDKCYLKQFTLEEYERKLKTLLVAEFYPKNELESPNVFLAYLLKPQFLSLQKWEKIFRAVIAKNWLEWGGFSTLPKSAPNFKKVHTGENSESYHQGDSWFWLNNVAAIAIKYFQEQANPDKMSGRRSDTKRFACSSYIEKVKSASVKNLLELDALGWSSELSSACQLKSEGSPIQLWSIASLLKLFSRE
jgi:glycogen debranching enzyme